MAALSGASALDWARREILGDEPYPALEAAVADIPVGSGGVMYHPYLFGERAPFRAPTASGAFFGLRASHTKYHMARAAFEGVALSLYDCYQSLPKAEGAGGADAVNARSGVGVDTSAANADRGMGADAGEIIVAGGAASNDLLCQMISDCVGVPVTRDRRRELGVAGVARLLRERFGGGPPREEAKDHFAPNLARHEQYQALYADFTALQRAMRPFWEK
jgi:sugar (pentulose or hexulose) kinase